MRVIVDDTIYEIPRQQALALADSAKKYVPLGIYAVEKDGILELKKEAVQSKTQLKRMVREYKEKGFKVWWNG